MEYTTTINSLGDFIQAILKYRENNNISRDKELWFRGQKNKNWGLIPTLYRNDRLPRYNIYDKYNQAIKPNTGIVGQIKATNIIDFPDELGSFISEIRDKVNVKNFNKFHYMMLGQHTGLLTPALDWTANPLVALFFAIDGYKMNSSKKGIADKCDPVVHLIKPWKLLDSSSTEQMSVNVDNLTNEDFKKMFSDINSEKLINPIPISTELNISSRLLRQAGRFTIQGPLMPAPIWYQGRKGHANGEYGFTIIIKRNSIERLKKELNALGINKQSIYGSDPYRISEIAKKVSKRINKKYSIS